MNLRYFDNILQGRTTGAIRVREKGGDTMERGDKDQIAVELTGHYDDLETIGVSQDGAGAGRYTISIEYILLYLLLCESS